MVSQLVQAFREAVAEIPGIGVSFMLCALAFLALSVSIRGVAGALKNARAAVEQTRINAIFSMVDQVAVSPFLTLISAGAALFVRSHFPHNPLPAFWLRLPGPVVIFLAVFLGDFIAYWRHRLQHSPALWPPHAVHHSDTHMTWFTLERMHPIDRLGTLFDLVALTALGLPAWALLANVLVRHFYGYLIHADAPWTLGPLNRVFNTPVMHRWHHARDIEGSGSNFATVFSVFDRAFGTYHQPGPCTGPMGVREDMGRGALGQYLYPLRVWFGGAKVLSGSSAIEGQASPSA
jgi:sterol desaturase/sphingolipid hydroxylase (fatty acid hydroxylase superfamily)